MPNKELIGTVKNRIGDKGRVLWGEKKEFGPQGTEQDVTNKTT